MVKLLWGTIIIDYKSIWRFITYRLQYFWWWLFIFDRKTYRAEISTLHDRCDKYERQIETIKKNKSKAHIEEVNRYRAEIQELKERLLQSENNNAPLMQKVNSLGAELEMQRAVSNRLKQQYQKSDLVDSNHKC